MRSVLFSGACVLVAACGEAPPESALDARWIDLTHPFDAESVYWPTSDTFELDVLSNDFTEAGYFYAANRFRAAEHGGTHVDAPVHCAKGSWTLDQIPLRKLMGPAVVVNVTEAALADRDYQVDVEALRAWEREHGPIPDGAIVLLHTGYGRYWPDREKYMGTAARGASAVAELRFPGLHPDAARWLVENRTVHAVGLDTPSIDYGRSTLFESHRILFEHNVPAFENVAHLDQLPAVGAEVIALPMLIRGGSGGPLRIVARL